MRHPPFLSTITLLALALSHSLFGQDLVILGDDIVDPNALNFSSSAANFSQNVNGRTYQRHPMTTFKGYQYTTYYDQDRQVCVGRRKLPSGTWEVIRYPDYNITNNDSHNSTAIGICHLDGTIHLAFDHHADPLNYLVSTPGAASEPETVEWNSALFGSVSNQLGSVSVGSSFTYPTFFNAPNGNLMLYYRDGGSGNGDGMLQEYDGTTSQWTAGMGKIISKNGSYTGAVFTNSSSRNPYLNGISYGGNRLHVSWGWRESSNGSSNNHDLNYAYSDDHGRTWFNSAGSQIGTIGSGALSIDSPGLVVAAIPQNTGLSNQFTHYAFPDGSCHIMLSYHEAGTSTRRYHHHWRSASGTWHYSVLPLNGSRPKLVGEDNGNLFLAYASGNRLRIAKGSPHANQSHWNWSLIHTQSDSTEGGEGHIDTTRWELDNVLSVYGQEKANSDGAATPLHIRDYQVSTRAVQPIPFPETCGVSPSALQWTPGFNAIAHHVYLGTDPNAVQAASQTSTEFRGKFSSSSYLLPSPLAGATTYFWRIDEVDSSNNVREGRVWSFTTAATPPIEDGVLLSLSSDASIRDIPDVIDTDSNTTLLGTGGPSGARVDRCTVFVFQLPNLGVVESPFTHATLQFEYTDKDGNLEVCDLYGLGRRNSETVLAQDYYGQTRSLDPSDATFLQGGILDNSTSFGIITTSTAGESALGDYLNAQYDGGAGAGSYIFLRLNTAANSGGINRAKVTMSEGGSNSSGSDTRPQIQFGTTNTATEEEKWRYQHFGTIIPTGTADPLADPNQDGESNFLEFATGQDPHGTSLASTPLRLNPEQTTLIFEYPRSSAALADKLLFIVEWSENLLPDSWSTDGVAETFEADDPFVQLVNASLPTGRDGRRFVRLRITR
ncbi:BNR repeat-containing protein [Roseibacillus persicicus]|uniref:BNR repeat-containing protein n=1 Tax=Roseibacillus persicicus TaxID=454148 RepID=UPI00280C51C7|nr:BNR repeat-containing protein [Roseibacillus persicicus]MDQ8188942.1 BNR repeat-containing protein [Roseibacillus persicicus]